MLRRELPETFGARNAMRDRPARRSQPEPKKRVVIYHVAPSSFWGRVFAFFLAAVILVVALFISFMVFWAILTIVLFLIIYVLWTSRRSYEGKSKEINVDHGQE